MSNRSHAGRWMILSLLLERNMWIFRDGISYSFARQILWLCEMTTSGRRQQFLSDTTTFYCFSEAKTHLHILWNTVRLAHGSKGKMFLILSCFIKRTLGGIKTACQAAKSTCEASQIQQLKWTNSHILVFLTNNRGGGKMLKSAEDVKYCFWDSFCHKYWRVDISVHCYSVDFLCLVLDLAVSLRRALRKKGKTLKTNQTKLSLKYCT